jgi:hypothetical protein
VARKKKFQGQGWAKHDASWAGLFLAVLAFGAVSTVFLYAALVMLVTFVAVLAARAWRRRAIARQNANAPHWIDRIKD